MKKVIFVVLLIISFCSFSAMIDDMLILGDAKLGYIFGIVASAALAFFVILGKNTKVIMLATIVLLMSIATYAHLEQKVEHCVNVNAEIVNIKYNSDDVLNKDIYSPF